MKNLLPHWEEYKNEELRMKNEEFATALRIVFLTQTTSRQNKKTTKKIKKTIKTLFCCL